MRRVAVIALALLAMTACARILGLRSDTRRAFPHRAHLIEGVSCVTCHPGMTEAGSDAPLHLPSSESCVTCHKSPHDERPCLSCHSGEFTAMDALQRRKHLRFSHKAHLPNADGNCVRCHGDTARGTAGSDSIRIGRCLSCHTEGPQSQVDNCDACHARIPRELRPPADHIVHDEQFANSHGAQASTSRELCAGCHRETFCASCHGIAVPALPSRSFFDRPDGPGIHRAGFASRHAEEAGTNPGMCATCHTEQTCRNCHQEEKVSARSDLRRASPHPPGWVGPSSAQNEHGRAARRDPLSCASCHGGAGEALCVDCHRVGGVGGNPHPPGWSSRKSMRDVPCRACHFTGAR